jgi:triacylglycerol lipase
MNMCKNIEFYLDSNNGIPHPSKGISLHNGSGFSKSIAIELANLTRIAYRDFEIYEENDKNRNKKLESNGNFEKGDFIHIPKESVNSELIPSYSVCSSSISASNTNEYRYEILDVFYYLQYWLAVPDQTRFGFIARRKISENKYRVFFVFRGTRELGEWFNNSQLKQIKFLVQQWEKPATSKDTTISFGFNKIYTNYRPGLFLSIKPINQIFTFLERQFRRAMNSLFKISEQGSMYQIVQNIIHNPVLCPPDSDIYLAGHSLGAALATISALHIGSLKKFNQPPSVYTFASPRVGNPEFAKVFDTYGISCYRIANSEDVVTHVPPNSGKLLGPEMNNPKERSYSLFQRAVGTVEAYAKSPVAILTLRTQVYEHVGEPFYFTHQTGYWSSNHNMDVTYGGAILKIEDR